MPGPDATLYTLRMIDEGAERFTSPADLVWKFFGSGAVLPEFWSSTPTGSPTSAWLESGVSGVTMYLDDNDNGQLDWTDADGDGVWDAGEGERWTVTQSDDPATPNVNETGYYQFDNLAPGTYIVREVMRDGWEWIPPITPQDDDSLVHTFHSVEPPSMKSAAYRRRRHRRHAVLRSFRHCGSGVLLRWR